MNDRIRQITDSWPRSNRSTAWLVVGIAFSLALHIFLLLLDFGEYGQGLPGFELPSTDRRGQLPDLHIALQKPATPDANSVPLAAIERGAPLPTLRNTIRPPVETFELVPVFRPEPAPVAQAPVIAPVAKVAVPLHRNKPKLMTSPVVNPDFKVAESEQAAPEPSMVEDEKAPDVKEAAPVSEPQLLEPPQKLVAEEQERAAAEKRAAEKLDEERQAKQIADQQKADKEAQEKLASEKQALEQQKLREAALQAQRLEQEKLDKLALEQRLAAEKEAAETERQRQQKLQEQKTAEQLEKTRQEALARQQEEAERERARQEKIKQAQIAERIAEEQRKLAEAVKLQQQQEQAKREQMERARLAQELTEKLAEKQRLEQAQLKQRQEEQDKQAAEVARQRELARQAEAARAEASALAARARQTARTDDLNDILGAGGDAKSNPGTGAGKPDVDKLLSGRSADFDKTGEAIKSGAGTTLASPKLESNAGARRSIFGSKNGDIDLNLYIQSWRQKVERNGRLNYAQSAKDKAFSDPIVTVSIRKDGSVENVVILRSSGNRDIDEAVRRITLLNAPYSAFPPSLARRFDVIDIRQIWIFDESLRITDEMR